MKKFLDSLVCASEKAAVIARVCRRENELFKLLIEEKKGKEKNEKFCHDFKTLADVLIQETVRHDIGKSYPMIKSEIYGEESNKFTNTLGETIAVEVQPTEKATSELLMKVLDGNSKAATLLANAVHSPVTLTTSVEEDIARIPGELELNASNCGIWIDPIDSTAQYIKGTEEIPLPGQMFTKGLQVVTVLVGVYCKDTGEPIVGVVNQPFHTRSSEDIWSGQIYWGLCYKGARFSSGNLLPEIRSSKPTAIVSSSEDRGLVARLEEHYACVQAAGAGHKLLMVAKGAADVYVTAKPSTYKWDSCAPDAILNSLNGRALEFTGDRQYQPITYGKESPENNATGIFAYRNLSELERVKQIFVTQ